MKNNFIIFLCVTILVIFTPTYPTISDVPITQNFGYKNHVGVDFTLPVGSPVYAVLPGRVIKTEMDKVYGRYIMIEHLDGYASLYGHLSEIKVKEGNWVVSGKLIALSGGDPNDKIDGDGWSSGAHLHFEIRVPDHFDNNLYNIDPMKYLGFDNEE